MILARHRGHLFFSTALSGFLIAAYGCSNSVQEDQTSTAGSTGSSSGASSSSGAGGGVVCVPGTLVDCYTGPKGTENVGVCHGGAKKCNDDGLTFGPCQWEVTPAAEDCKTLEDEDCDGATLACPGGTVWSESLSGKGSEFAESVAVDANGDIILTGVFNTTLSLGGATLTSVGQEDFFVAKLDPTGKVLWAKGYGSTSKDYSTHIAVDAQGNIAVTGSASGNIDLGDGPLANAGMNDIFIIKLDPSGKFLWRKMFGSPMSDIGYDITFDPQGNVIATGQFQGTIDFGTGSLLANAADAYVVKFAPDGAPLWAQKYGAAYPDYGSRVATSKAGEILVAGGFKGPVDFGTGPIMTPGYYDGFLLKLDPAGNAMWVTQMKGGATMGSMPVPYGIGVDGSGAAVVGGYFFGQVDLGGGMLASAGGSDAFVARYDASGKHVYSARYGGAYVNPNQPNGVTDGVFGVAVDDQGNAWLTGGYGDTIDMGGGPLVKAPYRNTLLARLDPGGKHLFSKGYGGAVSYSVGIDVALTPKGNAVVAGYFAGDVDFGTGTLSSPTTQDTDLFLFEASP
jgi:hypothetical protein